MIKVGDLVVAVRANCKHSEVVIGRPFVVESFADIPHVRCAECKRWWQRKHPVIGSGPAARGLPGFRIPVSWLVKINPLSKEDEAAFPQERPISIGERA